MLQTEKEKSNMSKTLFQTSKSRRRRWGNVKREEGNGRCFQVVVYSAQQQMCEEKSIFLYIHILHTPCVSSVYKVCILMLIIHYKHQKYQFSLIKNLPGWPKHRLFSSLAKDYRQICVIGAEELFSLLFSPQLYAPPLLKMSHVH